MSVSPTYKAFVLEQLGRVADDVRARSMFGGVGVYSENLFFALIDDDVLYLKVDDTNRPDFEAHGMGPFQPFGPGGEVMQYYTLPEGVLDEPDELRPWVERAIAVARNKKKTKPGTNVKKARMLIWWIGLATTAATSSACSGSRVPEHVGAAEVPVDSSFGFGTDTTTKVQRWTAAGASGTEATIYRNWMAYVKERAEANRPFVSKFWNAAETAQETYDIAGSWVDAGLKPRVVTIRPTSTRGDEYEIQTVWSGALANQGIVEHAFAVRDGSHWLLSSALRHNTRDWLATTIGSITYHYPSTHPFDSLRAHRLIAFADSVAKKFGVAPLPPLHYYLAASGDEAIRLVGIENWVHYPNESGAFSRPGIVVAGDPKLAEEYRHEIVHHLFAPLMRDGQTDGLISEGVAVWLGGTKGASFDEARRRYAAYLRAHPAASLDSTLAHYDRYHGVAGAVLVQMAHEAGGNDAVKSLFGTGRPLSTGGRAGVERTFGLTWPEIAAKWRARAAA